MSFDKPRVEDLLRLSRLLERDRELSLQALRERDHAIGERCPAVADADRLVFWAGQVAAEDAERARGRLSEQAAAWLLRIVVFLSGAGAMAGFLFASGRGLVNVFLFLLLFVVVQVALSLLAALVMLQTLRGRSPFVLPLNPALLVVARLLPDRRDLPELQSVLRLVILRYGQELGAIFTLGAILAFFLVLGISDFSFVWGSTFQVSDELVARLTGWLAAPWSGFLPRATVDPAVIAATRFHPAITELGMADVARMRGWWPFLIVSMVCYALIPRLLLWALSRYLFARGLRAAITGLPGSERVLARMRAPVVSTGGSTPPPAEVERDPDPRLLLVSWANALAPGEEARFAQLHAIAPGQRLEAGLGSPAADRERVAARLTPPVDRLWVAVKSWEPPMADLADFLARLERVKETTLLLVPLAHREVSDARLEDWRGFARELGPVAVLPLQWPAETAGRMEVSG